LVLLMVLVSLLVLLLVLVALLVLLLNHFEVIFFVFGVVMRVVSKKCLK
jgi:hypothetical protein